MHLTHPLTHFAHVGFSLSQHHPSATPPALPSKYNIAVAQLLGTTTLLRPDTLRVQLTFYSIDNVPECPLICSRPGAAIGITGKSEEGVLEPNALACI